MRQVAITDFLSIDEIEAAIELFQRDGADFVGVLAKAIIRPNMTRINAALGRELDAQFLAYTVMNALCIAEDQQAN